MKIGLYGDSFGVTLYPEGHSFVWYNDLCNRLGATLSNHCVGASSLYHSYKTFLNSDYQSCDLIIFLVTDLLRYSKKLDTSIDLFDHWPGLVAIDYAKEQFKDQLTTTDLEILRDLEGWFICSDDQMLLDTSQLMIDKINSLHENVLILPVFDTYPIENNTGVDSKGKYSFFNFVKRQYDLLGIKYSIPGRVMLTERLDTTAAHFGSEFNEFIADVMYKGITTNVWDWSGYTNVRMKHPKQYYYTID